MAGKGLWYNIHMKRKRGERMRKKGEKGAPSTADIKRAQGEDAKMFAKADKDGYKKDNLLGTPELTKKYKEATPGQTEKANPRIPRKKGQPAGSKKHSDLYTDENPKGTIHGLKFATAEDARKSVAKIKSSGKSHAHKIQAAIAMEQRARVMGKTAAAAVYRSFINAMKEKTKKMRKEHLSFKDYIFKFLEKAPNTSDAMKRYKAGKAGFTDKAHLKAKGLIPRSDGTKRKSDKYK
tara:strand:+ start:3522 stop:4229 length:708 start_codon:yes stop_codon:yes gene_type:complete